VFYAATIAQLGKFATASARKENSPALKRRAIPVQ
jgi:hypothetical protein